MDRHIVENVPQGVHCNFLKAERSLHRWAHEDVQRIHLAETSASQEGAGVEMHVLEDAGHWVGFQAIHNLYGWLYKSSISLSTIAVYMFTWYHLTCRCIRIIPMVYSGF